MSQQGSEAVNMLQNVVAAAVDTIIIIVVIVIVVVNTKNNLFLKYRLQVL
jgi:hypothetical protein